MNNKFQLINPCFILAGFLILINNFRFLVITISHLFSVLFSVGILLPTLGILLPTTVYIIVYRWRWLLTKKLIIHSTFFVTISIKLSTWWTIWASMRIAISDDTIGRRKTFSQILWSKSSVIFTSIPVFNQIDIISSAHVFVLIEIFLKILGYCISLVFNIETLKEINNIKSLVIRKHLFLEIKCCKFDNSILKESK